MVGCPGVGVEHCQTSRMSRSKCCGFTNVLCQGRRGGAGKEGGGKRPYNDCHVVVSGIGTMSDFILIYLYDFILIYLSLNFFQKEVINAGVLSK